MLDIKITPITVYLIYLEKQIEHIYIKVLVSLLILKYYVTLHDKSKKAEILLQEQNYNM